MNTFVKLNQKHQLPLELQANFPETLWIKSHQANSEGLEIILKGNRLDGGQEIALIGRMANGDLKPLFDIHASIRGIRLEEYYDNLIPTLEMRLPFNYSKIPNWIKGIARSVRQQSFTHSKDVDFPSENLPFVVEWLTCLAQWSNVLDISSGLKPTFNRAKLIITHDVDTNWLFNNRTWLKKIVELEAKYGLRGAWYCVPLYSKGKNFEYGIKYLRDNGCEIGCHGYNHDAKLAIMEGSKLENRLSVVQRFADLWNIRGFRSEWLWRSKHFLEALSDVFIYDTSVPNVSANYTQTSNNGCGTCLPYITHGGMVEIPLTLPMDENRHGFNQDLNSFWNDQFERSQRIAHNNGVITLSLHPQPHQSANNQSLDAFEGALEKITNITNIEKTTPLQIAEQMMELQVG